MKEKTVRSPSGHIWHFVQVGGLVQLKISTIEDVLHLAELSPKLWVALACPVKGLEFSEETLELLDTDKNGRVRVPEILAAVDYIKKYFKRPEVIMTSGDAIPLDALSDEALPCGYSPAASAKSVLGILGKPNTNEISLADVSVNDKLFSPTVLNGDGVLPPDAVKDETAAAVIKDIVACTGGSDDISGAKGTTRGQFEGFFNDLRAVKDWRHSAEEKAPDIFFLKFETDAAASVYMKVRDKINDFFLRCSLGSYDSVMADAITKKEEDAVISEGAVSNADLADLPIAICAAGKALPLGAAINPAWKTAIDDFAEKVVLPIFGAGKTCITEAEWHKVDQLFTPYMAWSSARPESTADSLSFDRIDEILASDAESVIASCLDEEEKHPPVALATVDLRKMILYRRDFVELLRNFVSFEKFYDMDEDAVFQCGTLYIDGRACDLCFRVTDAGKHATMSPLSQCFLLYCSCKRPETGSTMEIAALVSAGSHDNLIVGRNGLFFDRDGNDWDATITKIVENPISIREAFWSPYKKLMRMIQERIAKSAAEAEAKSDAKLAGAVADPNAAANSAKESAATKKFDVGTIAAISVAFTGMAAIVGGVLQAFLGLGYWIPLGIAGIILAISLPSMFIAWLKLRQRNIAPILDASGWAVNGNVKINIPLGAVFTSMAVRPRGSKVAMNDPYKQKGFPIKRIILCVILIALVVWFAVSVAKNPDGLSGVVAVIKGFFLKFVPSKG